MNIYLYIATNGSGVRQFSVVPPKRVNSILYTRQDTALEEYLPTPNCLPYQARYSTCGIPTHPQLSVLSGKIQHLWDTYPPPTVCLTRQDTALVGYLPTLNCLPYQARYSTCGIPTHPQLSALLGRNEQPD